MNAAAPRPAPRGGRPPACRVLLVDDHALMREMLRRLLDAPAGAFSVVEAACGAEALQAMGREAFDVASIDLSLPDMSGLELIRALRRSWPATPLVALTMDDDEVQALHAFDCGVSGYVTKDRAATELAVALRSVAAGGVHIGRGVAGIAARLAPRPGGGLRAAPHAGLSARELAVLVQVARGDGAAAIASSLQIDVATVERHIARVLERLALPDLAALQRYGVEQGLDRHAPGADTGR